MTALVSSGVEFIGLAAESDSDLRKALATNFPDVVIVPRVENFKKEWLEAVLERRRFRGVLIGAGPPCQPNSALNDDSWELEAVDGKEGTEREEAAAGCGGGGNSDDRERIVYARVSSHDQKEDLQRQIEDLRRDRPDHRLIFRQPTAAASSMAGLENLAGPRPIDISTR